MELIGRYSNPEIVSVLQRVLAGRGLDRASTRTVRSVRQSQIRLAQPDVQKIIDRYRAGESSNVLAAEFGVHRSTIKRHVERAGLITRYRILTEHQIVTARQLYEQGWSLARLGEHFGVATRTMLNAFQRAGVPTRPVGTNQWSR